MTSIPYIPIAVTYQAFKQRYRYSDSDLLGGGRYGKVYKARDAKQHNKLVAIKEPTEEATRKYRLKNEIAKIMALPQHTNIATYIDYYTFTEETGNEKDFIVMQYYESGSLRQLLKDKKLSVADKEKILYGILNGLEFLHENDLIHRDLKPENILISKQGDQYVPKISDFGTCKELIPAAKSGVVPNSEIGTPVYSSPEQLLSNDPVGKNTDLWNFGIIANELFTGRDPHVCKKVVENESVIPEQWLRLIKQCLVVDVGQRVQTVAECKDILEMPPPEEYVEEPDEETSMIEEEVEPIEEEPSVKEEPPVKEEPLIKEEPPVKEDSIITPPKEKQQATLLPFLKQYRNRIWIALAVIALIAIAAVIIFTLTQPKSPTIDINKANEIWKHFSK
jgi:serine/threonine protein kinase